MKKRVQALAVFISVCVILCSISIFAGVRREATDTEVAPKGDTPTVETVERGRVTRILVMGVDRAARLTDSIFILTLDESARSMRILQIPRDTYAQYTDGKYKKINGALKVLGETETRRWFSEILGVRIQYFAVVDLTLLRDLVDTVGGVDLDCPQEMHYSDPAQDLEIHLPKGPIHLDGAAAEQFVRYRSGYPNADLGRLDAQKLFLRAFAQKCRTLSSAQLLRLTCSSLTRLQTDLDLTAAIRLSKLLRQCDTENIPMATLVGQAERGSSGAWYYVVNREGACRSINEYLLPDMPLQVEQFDPNGLFDRPDFEKFHKIYLAPESTLPLG